MRCDYCGDAIGVYEPIVVIADGLPFNTSRAAEPSIGGAAGARYHHGCYLEYEQRPVAEDGQTARGAAAG